VHAYLRGELDAAQLTTVEAVDICHQQPKRCPVVVLILDESRGGDMVAARRQFGSMAELRGRRVAVTPSTLGPYVLSRALQREGLGLDAVEVVPMPMGEMAGRLARGEVDGAAFFPPFSDYALRLGLAKVLFDSSAIPGEIFDVLVVAPDLVLQRRQELVKLLRTWQLGARLCRALPGCGGSDHGLPGEAECVALPRGAEGAVLSQPGRPATAAQPWGVLDRNLAAVQRVQVELGLVAEGSPLPRVDDEPLRLALLQPRLQP
jgi:NitT/TauT family transport system substrate-binding protein